MTVLAVVDTGNWFTYLDPEMANAINELFDPLGQWNTATSPITYSIDCDTTPPKLGFIIGGEAFFHNGQDLIYSTGDGNCVSALVSNEGVGLYGLTGSIIGDAFLKNVVAVFDFGSNEMGFAARTGDGSNTSSTSAPAPAPLVGAAPACTGIWYSASWFTIAAIFSHIILQV